MCDLVGGFVMGAVVGIAMSEGDKLVAGNFYDVFAWFFTGHPALMMIIPITAALLLLDPGAIA